MNWKPWALVATLGILAGGIAWCTNRGDDSKPPPRTNVPPAAAPVSDAASGVVAQASAPKASAAPQAASAPQPPASSPAAADAPAPAASQAAAVAPAPAASAPAPVVQAADPAPVASATSDKTYTIQQGDVLSLVFPKDWRKVCELSYLKDCNKLVIGDKLVLPEGVEPREARQAVRHEPKAARSEAQRTTTVLNKNAAGEILYRRVGTAPLKGCGRLDPVQVSEAAWEALSLPEEDRKYLREHIDPRGPRVGIIGADKQGLIMIPNDTLLEKVTFCRQGKVVAQGPMRTAWGNDKPVPAERFVLPSGKAVAWMDECFNWIPVEAPPPPTIVVRQPTPPIEIPIPTEQPRLPTPPIEITVPTPGQPVAQQPPKDMCDRIDPFASLAKEYEPSHNDGDHAESTMGTFSAYCLNRRKTKDGSEGFGGKVTASKFEWQGNHRAAHSRGWEVIAGLSYKRVMDIGTDSEFSVGVGKKVDHFRQAAYAEDRRYTIVGATFSHNDYRRRFARQKWRPELQMYGGITIPVNSEGSRSIFGQPIGGEVARFNFGIQAGVRQWLYETPRMWVLPYVQAGIFVQHPTNASMSFRLGGADPERFVGAGAGVDIDLKHGGKPVFAWGPWIEPIKGVDVVRHAARRSQVVSDGEAAAQSLGATKVEVRKVGDYIDTIDITLDRHQPIDEQPGQKRPD